MNRVSLLTQIKANENITLLPKTKCVCIRDHTLFCEDENGAEIQLPFDLVVAAMGMKFENVLAKKVLEEFPEAYMIGDAVQHLKIGDAVHQAFFTALRI